MRDPLNAEKLRIFMREIAQAAREPGRVYIVGGAGALLRGWRASTLDVDLVIVPENGRILAAIPELKERLNINVELASPADFVPALRGWEERSRFIEQIGPISFHHYDFYTQCLAKLERDHETDRADVGSMVREGLVDPKHLLSLYREAEPELARYPAIHPPALRARVEAFALQ
jgi:predicted nucleotidyltransferase